MAGAPLSPASLRVIPVHAIDSAPPADTGNLRLLFDSILQWGVLQPLLVRRTGPRYEVLAGRKRYAVAIAAGLSELPCLVLDVAESEAPALAAATNVAPPPVPAPPNPVPSAMFLPVLQELHAARAAIAGALALADVKTAGLRRHVARGLVQVELQRCAWMLDGLLAFNPGGPEHRAPVSAGSLLGSVAAAFQPECRLAGFEVRLQVTPSDLVVHANESQLRVALHCVTGALLTSMHGERQTGAVLSFHGRMGSGGTVLSVAQNVVAFQRLAKTRAGRRGEPDDPDAGLTAFGFDVAKRVVEAHGGRLELRPDQESGVAVDLKIPPVD